jgi:hypothetical protein
MLPERIIDRCLALNEFLRSYVPPRHVPGKKSRSPKKMKVGKSGGKSKNVTKSRAKTDSRGSK